MTIPTAPPPPADPADSGVGAPPTAESSSREVPHGAERFLLWVAGIGVARSEGWLGGVAAGIAARLRIDPLIVRGVLVVAALFGLPVIFLYAVAWVLLPDVDGRVHARDLLQRNYQPVQLGILAMAIVGLLPTAPLTGRLFGLGYDSWSALSTFSWIVGLLIAGALLFLIVRAARRTPGDFTSDLPVSSAGQTAPGASVPLRGSGTAEGADATFAAAPVSSDAAHESSVPPTPPAPLPPEMQDPADIAAWRAQHAAWKEQDQAWRREQQDAERAVRDRLRQERQAAAAEFAAEAAERRRIRRACNPSAGFAFVTAVVGLAIVAGACVGLWSDAGVGVGSALGLLTAALVLALGMIVAGAFRRRSGFLAFVTVLTLAGGLVAGAVSSVQNITLGFASVFNDRPAEIRQPFGDLHIGLNQHDGAPRPIVVEKGTGSTQISVDAGVQLQLRATVETATVSWVRLDLDTGTILDSGVWTPSERGGRSVVVEAVSSERAPTTTVQPVTIDQNSGDISVTIMEPAEDER